MEESRLQLNKLSLTMPGLKEILFPRFRREELKLLQL